MGFTPIPQFSLLPNLDSIAAPGTWIALPPRRIIRGSSPSLTIVPERLSKHAFTCSISAHDKLSQATPHAISGFTQTVKALDHRSHEQQIQESSYPLTRARRHNAPSRISPCPHTPAQWFTHFIDMTPPHHPLLRYLGPSVRPENSTDLLDSMMGYLNADTSNLADTCDSPRQASDTPSTFARWVRRRGLRSVHYRPKALRR